MQRFPRVLSRPLLAGKFKRYSDPDEYSFSGARHALWAHGIHHLIVFMVLTHLVHSLYEFESDVVLRAPWKFRQRKDETVL